MYAPADGRVMFLDPEVAGQIETLGINVRENVTITRHCDTRKGCLLGWELARLVGEQPNGTLAQLPYSAEGNPLFACGYDFIP